jgi:membrane protein CcdC involved in cytochrome C biogenesis
LINARYFELPAAILVHGVSGIVFFFSLPTQFSTRLRVTRPKMHRVMGRLAVVSACVMAISGIWMHLVFSPANLGARFISLVIVAIAICVSFSIAIAYAMKKNITAHKIWMTRAVAVTLAVVTPLFLGVILSLFIDVNSTIGELAVSILNDYDRLLGLVLNLLLVEVCMNKKQGDTSFKAKALYAKA